MPSLHVAVRCGMMSMLIMLTSCVHDVFLPRHTEYITIDISLQNSELMPVIKNAIVKAGNEKIIETIERCEKFIDTNIKIDDCKELENSSWAWYRYKITNYSDEEGDGFLHLNDYYGNTGEADFRAKVKRESLDSVSITIKGLGPFMTALPLEIESKKLAQQLSEAIAKM